MQEGCFIYGLLHTLAHLKNDIPGQPYYFFFAHCCCSERWNYYYVFNNPLRVEIFTYNPWALADYITQVTHHYKQSKQLCRF